MEVVSSRLRIAAISTERSRPLYEVLASSQEDWVGQIRKNAQRVIHDMWRGAGRASGHVVSGVRGGRFDKRLFVAQRNISEDGNARSQAGEIEGDNHIEHIHYLAHKTRNGEGTFRDKPRHDVQVFPAQRSTYGEIVRICGKYSPMRQYNIIRCGGQIWTPAPALQKLFLKQCIFLLRHWRHWRKSCVLLRCYLFFRCCAVTGIKTSSRTFCLPKSWFLTLLCSFTMFCIFIHGCNRIDDVNKSNFRSFARSVTSISHAII